MIIYVYSVIGLLFFSFQIMKNNMTIKELNQYLLEKASGDENMVVEFNVWDCYNFPIDADMITAVTKDCIIELCIDFDDYELIKK